MSAEKSKIIANDNAEVPNVSQPSEKAAAASKNQGESGPQPKMRQSVQPPTNSANLQMPANVPLGQFPILPQAAYLPPMFGQMPYFQMPMMPAGQALNPGQQAAQAAMQARQALLGQQQMIAAQQARRAAGAQQASFIAQQQQAIGQSMQTVAAQQAQQAAFIVQQQQQAGQAISAAQQQKRAEAAAAVQNGQAENLQQMVDTKKIKAEVTPQQGVAQIAPPVTTKEQVKTQPTQQKATTGTQQQQAIGQAMQTTTTQQAVAQAPKANTTQEHSVAQAPKANTTQLQNAQLKQVPILPKGQLPGTIGHPSVPLVANQLQTGMLAPPNAFLPQTSYGNQLVNPYPFPMAVPPLPAAMHGNVKYRYVPGHFEAIAPTPGQTKQAINNDGNQEHYLIDLELERQLSALRSSEERMAFILAMADEERKGGKRMSDQTAFLFKRICKELSKERREIKWRKKYALKRTTPPQTVGTLMTSNEHGSNKKPRTSSNTSETESRPLTSKTQDQEEKISCSRTTRILDRHLLCYLYKCYESEDTKSIKQYWSSNLQKTVHYKKFRSAFKGCGLKDFLNMPMPRLPFESEEILTKVEAFFHQRQSERGKGQRCFLTSNEERQVLEIGFEQYFRQQHEATGILAMDTITEHTIDEEKLSSILKPLVTNIVTNDEKLKDMPAPLHEFFVRSILYQIFHWKASKNKKSMLKNPTIISEFEKNAVRRLKHQLSVQSAVKSKISRIKKEIEKLSALLDKIASNQQKKPHNYWELMSSEDLGSKSTPDTTREELIMLVEILFCDKSEVANDLLIPGVDTTDEMLNASTCELEILRKYFEQKIDSLGIALTKDLYDSKVEELRKFLQEKERQLQEAERELSEIEDTSIKETTYTPESDIDEDEELADDDDDDDGSVSDDSHQAEDPAEAPSD